MVAGLCIDAEYEDRQLSENWLILLEVMMGLYFGGNGTVQGKLGSLSGTRFIQPHE